MIIRQKGTRVNAGNGTMLSKDFTIIALKEGVVEFSQRKGEKIVSVK